MDTIPDIFYIYIIHFSSTMCMNRPLQQNQSSNLWQRKRQAVSVNHCVSPPPIPPPHEFRQAIVMEGWKSWCFFFPHLLVTLGSSCVHAVGDVLRITNISTESDELGPYRRLLGRAINWQLPSTFVDTSSLSTVVGFFFFYGHTRFHFCYYFLYWNSDWKKFGGLRKRLRIVKNKWY